MAFLDIFHYFYYRKIYVDESKYSTGSEECQLILTQFCSSKNCYLLKLDLFKFMYLSSHIVITKNFYPLQCEKEYIGEDKFFK